MALSFEVYLYLLGFFCCVFGAGWMIGRTMLGLKQILDASVS